MQLRKTDKQTFQARITSTVKLACGLIALTVGCVQTVSADIERTESGKPDLTGTYNGATLTPLTRPPEFGDNLYLTKEQAEKLSAEEKANLAKANAASDPNREAPPAGGDGSEGAAGNVGGYNAFWIDRGDDAMAVDGKFRTSVIVEPENGQFPPLTKAGQMRMAKLFGGVRRKNEGVAWWLEQEGPGPYDNMEQRNNAERCLLSFSGAVPSIPSLYNNFKRVVQTEDHVMIMIEMVHDARVVRLNSEHPGKHVKKWLGDSIGWWEGDTLVIDTTNFSEKTLGFLGGSDATHVQERLTPMENGDLLYRFTVTDDSHWTSPWTGEYVWRRSDDKVYEYACHEGNYALGNIMRGARILENDALEGASGGN
ncbi:MAG: hypothetical protein RIC89_09435 [Pseudomonadales bacterium]